MKSATKRKYKSGYPLSPTRQDRVRKAIAEVNDHKLSVRKAAKEHGLSYGFLHRRLTGEVDVAKRKGPRPVFSKEEEEAMATWLSEMAERGMGLKPGEFMDFVQGIVVKDKRQTPFTNDRPGHDWFYAFMARNAHLIAPKKEKPLESCRAKVTKDRLDHWYSKFSNFLLNKNMINSPKRIWNADETGFSMGSKAAGKVIGPSGDGPNIPHLSGGHSKQRFTVMFCGSAGGSMMPPFFIFPEPAPKGYIPLNDTIDGSTAAYTKKGWMDAGTFSLFLDHFDRHAGPERPVVLLIDSVSSHVHIEAFQKARSKGIELYRLLPNATHLMQPLDRGVFGPLKIRWHQVVRHHTRENPGQPITKANFAEKLKEAFFLFYKPLTVINCFKSSGIYPVDSQAISSQELKPSLTFSCSTSTENVTPEHDPNPAEEAFRVFRSVLNTPTKQLYGRRMEEGYDVSGKSPCFDAYKKLALKANQKPRLDSNMQLLADVSCQANGISATMKEALTFPVVDQPATKRRLVLDSLSDNLTSTESIREMALAELAKVRRIAEREIVAKEKYNRSNAKTTSAKAKSKSSKNAKTRASHESPYCIGCHMSWEEEQDMLTGSIWVQCDECDLWMHADCIGLSSTIDSDDKFCCPQCES